MNYEFTRLSDVNIADKINDLSHVLVEKDGEIVRVSADMFSSKEEVQALLSVIPKFAISAVDELPAEDISETTVYLLASGEDENLYTEYIYVSGAWEVLGAQKVDLTGYLKETDVAAVAISGEWDDLKGTPFTKETMEATYDGIAENRESFLVGTAVYVKVSDLEPSYDQLTKAQFALNDEELRPINGYWNIYGTDTSTSFSAMPQIIVAYATSIEVNVGSANHVAVEVPSPGIYMLSSTSVTRLVWTEITLDEKFIPSTIARADDVTEQIDEATAGIPGRKLGTVLLPETDASFTSTIYNPRYTIEASDEWFGIEELKVVFDGVEYRLTKKEPLNRTPYTSAFYGNVILAKDEYMDQTTILKDTIVFVKEDGWVASDEPFVIEVRGHMSGGVSEIYVWVSESQNGSDRHTISVQKINIVQLATEYLPEEAVAQADWDQTDENAANFVKNKPFGYRLIDGNVLTVESAAFSGTTVSLADYGIGNVIATSTGKKAVATLDGVDYECTVKRTYSNATLSYVYWFGNPSLSEQIPETEDNSLPFVVYNTTLIVKDDGEHTFALHMQKSQLVTLDPKYLPEIAKSQPDWDQNDESAADYIKNRTHYKEEGVVTLIDGSGLSFAHNNNVNSMRYRYQCDIQLSEPIMEGETYELYVKLEGVAGNTMTVVADANGLGDSSLPGGDYGTRSDIRSDMYHVPAGSNNVTMYYTVDQMLCSGASTFPITVKITRAYTNVVAIPEEFIPESIARTADIPEPFSGKWDDLEGKPFGIQIEENDIIPIGYFDVTLVSAADPAYYRIKPTLYTYELDSANEDQYITVESDNVNGVYPLVYRGVVDSSGTPIYAYGNASIENADLEDTGEPFMIRVVEGYVQYIDFKDNPGDTVTIHVYTQNEVINTIPDEYISETVRNQHVQPDWNQNDPEAADYVKGRTHYEETEIITVVDEGDYILGDSGGTPYCELPMNEGVIDNQSYIIYVNGVAYEATSSKNSCIAVWRDENSAHISIESGGWTYFDYDYVGDLGSTGDSVRIRVTRVNKVNHTIDPKYLPTTVPVIPTATVGQTIVVKAVDADGKPTEWEAADMGDGDSRYIVEYETETNFTANTACYNLPFWDDMWDAINNGKSVFVLYQMRLVPLTYANFNDSGVTYASCQFHLTYITSSKTLRSIAIVLSGRELFSEENCVIDVTE